MGELGWGKRRRVLLVAQRAVEDALLGQAPRDE
jgi:hypothetical protein